MKKLGMTLFAGLLVFDVLFVANYFMERQEEKVRMYLEHQDEIDSAVLEVYSK